jgi:glutamine synthetase
LDESLAELKKDEIVQESLGVIYEEFVALKEAELREFRRQVTPWEIDQYLTLF